MIIDGPSTKIASEPSFHAVFQFYTGNLGSSALAPVLYGRLADLTGPSWAAMAAAATAMIILPLMLLLALRLQSTARERYAT